MKDLLAESPLTLLKMMESVTARMDEVERRFVSICHDDVTTRLAHFLLERAPVITIAKKDLASVLGTSRETISRKLTEFQKDRSIVVKGRNIEIVNKEALGEKISG
ncbi:Crp/Fnr family transcriptional regulator [Bacillus sp. Hm123]|uniref:Crp/Fnr family transcriptional regulator n=1 Tax=Bacillus sp. Hm123 TaxID=3450745 RepID=UPI003F41E162